MRAPRSQDAESRISEGNSKNHNKELLIDGFQSNVEKLLRGGSLAVAGAETGQLESRFLERHASHKITQKGAHHKRGLNTK